MLVEGDVKCLHCGFVSGRWTGASGAPVTAAGIESAPSVEPKSDTAIECQRCGGPVVLDEATPVMSSRRLRRIRRMRAQLAAMDAARRDAA